MGTIYRIENNQDVMKLNKMLIQPHIKGWEQSYNSILYRTSRILDHVAHMILNYKNPKLDLLIKESMDHFIKELNYSISIEYYKQEYMRSLK